MKKVGKTLHYKQVTFEGTNPKRDLQSLAEQALQERPVAQRQQVVSSEENLNRIINDYTIGSEAQKALCASFIQYVPGRHPQMFSPSTDPEADRISLTDFPNDLAGKEFASSVLYFGVYGDAVCVASSVGLRAPDFEDHIDWLLKEAGLIEGSKVLLADPPPPKTPHSPIRSFEIGGPPFVGWGDEGASETAYGLVVPRSRGIQELLGGLFGGQKKWPVPLNDEDGLKRILDKANVRTKILVEASPKQKQDTLLFMNALRIGMRNMPSADYRVTLEDGSVIEGEEFKFRSKVRVPAAERGNVTQAGIYHEMCRFLLKHAPIRRADQ